MNICKLQIYEIIKIVHVKSNYYIHKYIKDFERMKHTLYIKKHTVIIMSYLITFELSIILFRKEIIIYKCRRQMFL